MAQDNLVLTTKERRNIVRGGTRAIRASNRRMKKKGFVMSREITDEDYYDHLGCDED